MQKHIQILGIGYIVYNALGVLFATMIWGLLSGVGLLSGDPQAAGILAFIGTVVATMFFIFSIPGIIGGIGLLKGWWWSRYLVLVLGAFNVFNVPLGTILGIYTFWVLMQDEAAAHFEAGGVVNAPPPA